MGFTLIAGVAKAEEGICGNKGAGAAWDWVWSHWPALISSSSVNFLIFSFSFWFSVSIWESFLKWISWSVGECYCDAQILFYGFESG